MANTNSETESTAKNHGEPSGSQPADQARARLASAGRNDPCPCGSGKKYKKCHLRDDEAVAVPPAAAPDAQEMLANAWRLFEQRRPGAAEREFRAALEAKPDLLDARVGIGMARLSSGNPDGAKEELSVVIEAGEKQAAELREQNVKDAFTRPEIQPYIRACHAIGCLAYDQDRFADAATDLERVYSIDEGTVGTEARLIAAKALMKLDRAADAARVLEPAATSETTASRVQLGLALAHVVAGAEDPARAALGAALDANPHYGKALLGRVRRRVEAVAGSQPGSLEEALVYHQTYGDVWTVAAKAFLEKVLDERDAARRAPPAAAPEAAATPG
ncbi:MAG TPA: SEC-C metal-binding domain-containing protein [Polyangia bacterium]|nr:SEC-C metal-binding domain-containing protein [Polyangia bacterium]